MTLFQLNLAGEKLNSPRDVPVLSLSLSSYSCTNIFAFMFFSSIHRPAACCLLLLHNSRLSFAAKLNPFNRLFVPLLLFLSFIHFYLSKKKSTRCSSNKYHFPCSSLTCLSQLILRCPMWVSPISVRNQKETTLESVTGQPLVKFLPWSTMYS